jgi:hypothetical protein
MRVVLAFVRLPPQVKPPVDERDGLGYNEFNESTHVTNLSNPSLSSGLLCKIDKPKRQITHYAHNIGAKTTRTV